MGRYNLITPATTLQAESLLRQMEKKAKRNSANSLVWMGLSFPMLDPAFGLLVAVLFKRLWRMF